MRRIAPDSLYALMMALHLFRPVLFASVVILALLAGGCSKSSPQRAHGPASVGVYTLKVQPYTLTATLPGRTSAYMTSDVRPQVNGIIQKRLFKEGSDVKAGQVLYQIDPSRYRAAYDSAKAQLAQARAAVQSARPKAERYQALAKMDAVSSQDKDNAVAALAQNKAMVATDKANLESARIDLGYTQIKAPIAGRIGASAYTPGALVTANQSNALATIHQLDPIYVDIKQTSSQFLQLRNALRSGQLKTIGPNEARVMVSADGASNHTMTGKLEFAGVTVDQDTGTVNLRAIVPNPHEDLLPGMYVNAKLAQGIDVKAILVPQQAVTRDTTGQATCLVVGSDNKVALRNIVIAGAADGNRWRVTGGLAAGDRVIVQGTDKVNAGDTVKPVEVTLKANGNAQSISGDRKTAPASAHSGNGQ